MKKFTIALIVLAALAVLARSLLPARNPGKFDVVGFGRLPVLSDGRMKPFDTVARTTLLQIQSTEYVITPDKEELKPIEWLLDVLFRPERADTYQTFKIMHPEVLTLFGLTPADGRGAKRFSFNQLKPKVDELERQARLASDVEHALRSPFQRGVLTLYQSLVQYQRLQHALVSPGRDEFLNDLLQFQEKLPLARAAATASKAGQPHDQAVISDLVRLAERFQVMARVSNLLVIPPEGENPDPNGWQSAGTALLDTLSTGQVNAHALAYAGLGNSWRHDRADQFNKIVELYRGGMTKRFSAQLQKCLAEARFNAADPFSTSFILYAFAFFAGMFSWMLWPHALGRTAFWLLGTAFLLTTAGILTRMWLEVRPPVTNLYSSALFIGWVAVALCMVLEHYFRNAIGSVAGGVVGFGTLIIADRLHLSGDTLEMMQAVLDSNFWLATHVVIVASGYAATFLAGFLALIYIVRGVFTRSLDKATADSLARMVYGIVCFATLFSFTGTVLGGIWADQSWGRFWGWDPKENGALLIVIWNAIILHARWGGMIKQRGLMALAVGGNIVTSWSWFGTNMLGVGLHSYGFTGAAFIGLIAFVVSQIGFIALANLPLEKWRSFGRQAGVGAQRELAAVGAK
ncbi:MAG TPA: cytochrome c biogenesis protein CcsA [Opitutaceae bacterium]|nr:cytochrome c biogenesis protein CcsA [Opitutaceae bacterium]